MAMYVTKSMLAKFNKVKYPSNTITDDDGSGCSDHWQKILLQRETGEMIHLAKDMICRICARNGCTPIMDHLTDGYDIISAIRMITNVTISLDDALPKYICSECLETLKLSMAFKKTCEISDKRFKQIANPMADPSFHSYPYSKHDFNLILHQMKLKRMKIEEMKERERQRLEKLFKRKNGPKEKQFKCSPCDITFSDKEKLTEHRRARQCMRRACDICGQLVLSISQHRRQIHKQSTPHKCTTCGKEFPIIARLKTHMLVHTNTFNFFCDMCPYKCKHKYYLVMHMRTHTGEKPYKCTQCPSTFVNPSNLNKHKLTHQEKQFKCGLCDKAFRTSPTLREHHEAAHMNIKHTCNYCGRDFCYKSDLRKHEIKTHNRVKRDYIGGEPTYKQVERMQKMEDDHDVKWRQQQIVVMSHTSNVLHSDFNVEEGKEFIYFSDPSLMPPPPPQQQIIQQPTVAIMPEMLVKKDEVKLYETQQGIGYF